MFRRLLAVAMTSVIAFGFLGTAAPAHAATSCKTNTRDIALPGKPDVSIKVQVCVERLGKEVAAHANIEWGSWATSHDRFNNFTLRIRLEEYYDGADHTRKVCDLDLTDELNRYTDGSAYCSTASLERAKKSGHKWSGDGYADYDVKNDGDPSKHWSLHGSPRIS